LRWRRGGGADITRWAPLMAPWSGLFSLTRTALRGLRPTGAHQTAGLEGKLRDLAKQLPPAGRQTHSEQDRPGSENRQQIKSLDPKVHIIGEAERVYIFFTGCTPIVRSRPPDSRWVAPDFEGSICTLFAALDEKLSNSHHYQCFCWFSSTDRMLHHACDLFPQGGVAV